MKRIILSVLAITVSVLALAQPQAKKVTADKIVAVVGDKIILKSDIDNSIIDMQRQGIEVPENANCMTLEQAMGIKALVLQAEKDSLPVTDEEIESDIDNQIRYFISQYGSKEELEKIAGKSIYQLKEDFKEGFRDRKLAQAMRNKIVDDIKITPNEVRNFYNKIPKDSLLLYESEVEISQLVYFPKASRDAEEYCISRLKEAKEQVESGKKDFKTIASQITEDPGSKTTGGEYTVNRSSKDLDPIWLNKAFTLKEGQISNPFKTQFGYHIMQMVSRAGDDATVRHILLVPQVTSIEMAEGVAKLDSIRNDIIAKRIEFGQAVTKYSNDKNSLFTAGQVQNNTGSTFLTIDQLDKDMVLMLKDLKVGQYSRPKEFTDERGKKGIRIVYLKTRTQPHRENLKDDYDRVAQRALEEKKNDAIEAWFNKKIPTYFIKIDPEYQGCEEMKKWINATKVAVKN
jgi:peptidyl-prolyl cis-trans isomerase SurA